MLHIVLDASVSTYMNQSILNFKIFCLAKINGLQVLHDLKLLEAELSLQPDLPGLN